jgi:hypothetical protein
MVRDMRGMRGKGDLFDAHPSSLVGTDTEGTTEMVRDMRGMRGKVPFW